MLDMWHMWQKNKSSMSNKFHSLSLDQVPDCYGIVIATLDSACEIGPFGFSI